MSDEQKDSDAGRAECSEPPTISLLTANVPQALQDLADSLDHAFHDPVNPIGRPRAEVAEQHRMADALIGVANFLRAIDPNGGEFAHKFAGLADALFHLETGKVSSIVSPYNGPGRRPDSSAIWARRALVALAIECMLRSDMNERQVAAEIAREPQLVGLLRDTPDVSTSKVIKSKKKKLESSCLNWHRLIQGGNQENPGATGTWAAGLSRIEAAPRTELRNLAKAFIELAARDSKNLLNTHL
jgi:hypothetical protein